MNKGNLNEMLLFVIPLGTKLRVTVSILETKKKDNNIINKNKNKNLNIFIKVY
tara:strand:+ start:540 stop:698 length:159 start_codon:yes stop_codon:yes gene_type:complete